MTPSQPAAKQSMPDQENFSAGKVLWLIGNKGMLGTELSLRLEAQGIPCIGTDREVDITDPAALAAFAETQGRTTPITWIINCAAYTAVDKAEDDVDFCRRLNAGGPANIARTAQKIGARLIHISTDYVFNGKGIVDSNTVAPRPYREDDPTDPIGVYGLTKRDGEIAIMENNPRSYIIRTAWLYGQYGANFVATMLRLMNERDAVSVVDDQRGSPTWARDLAETIIGVISTVESGRDFPAGIYHYTNEGSITWFDFAQEIYTQGRTLGLLIGACNVKPCTSAEFPAKVTRPAYSVLDKSKIKAALGITIPAWDMSLRRYLKIIAEQQGFKISKPEFDVRWKQRFENYVRALDQLTPLVNSLQDKAPADVDKLALVKAFELSFELAWNVMKDYLTRQGVKAIIGSRDAIRYAVQNGLIVDGEVWTAMIDSRNKAAHMYSDEIAGKLIRDVMEKYHSEFIAFSEKMKALAK
jgi:dTDP-4-dehydrorhamnose reductase